MFESLFSERGLSLDRLRVLVEVHAAGSIAQAAPDDPIRQSQYSRQIRELAEFFGCEVTQRQGKVLKLTPQGVRLASLAREHLQSLQDLWAETRSEAVDYIIGGGDSLIQWLVLPQLGKVARSFPDVRFATENLRTKQIFNGLTESRLDFGVLRKNAIPTGLRAKPLGKLDYVMVVPRKLRTGRGSRNVATAWREVPFVTQKSDGQFTKRLRNIASTGGTSFQPVLLCESFPQSLSAVKTGNYAAVLPRIATKDLAAKDFLVLTDPVFETLSRDLVLAWNPRITQIRPLALKLGEHLQALLAF
ncbi:MAG: hypothetical protein SynsKO_32730 [Synoicihabitans sp.]